MCALVMFSTHRYTHVLTTCPYTIEALVLCLYTNDQCVCAAKTTTPWCLPSCMLKLNTNLLPMCALYIFIIRVYCFYYNMNGFQMSDYRFFFLCITHVSSSHIHEDCLVDVLVHMNAGNIQVLEGTEDHDCPKRMFNLHFLCSGHFLLYTNKLTRHIVNVSMATCLENGFVSSCCDRDSYATHNEPYR